MTLKVAKLTRLGLSKHNNKRDFNPSRYLNIKGLHKKKRKKKEKEEVQSLILYSGLIFTFTDIVFKSKFHQY